MADQILRLVITGNVSGATKAMRDVQRSLDAAQRNLTQFGRSMTMYVTLPILAVGAAAGKLAMDAVESENLFDVSLAGMADSARTWSNDISKALGLNSYEVRKYLGTFDVMFQSWGLGKQQALEMSEGVTKLAYDMASFYNLDTETAFQKIRSGLAGQVRPLRELGISLDDAQVKTYAYAHGIAEQGREMTASEKVQARYGLLLQMTTKAQGDMARTIESPANQLRILQQRAINTGIAFGMLLLPALVHITKAVTGLTDWLNSLSEGQKGAIIQVALFAAAIGPAAFAIGKLAWALGIAHKLNMAIALSAKAAGTATAAQGLAAKAAAADWAALGATAGIVAAGIISIGAQTAGAKWLTDQIKGALGAREAYNAWDAELVKHAAFLRPLYEMTHGQTAANKYLGNSTGKVAQADKAAADAAKLAEEAMAQLQGGTKDLTTAQVQLTRALNGTMVAEDSLAGKQRTAKEASLAQRQAVLNLREARLALSKAIHDNGRKSDEAKGAQIRLEQAELDLKDKTYDLRTAHAKAAAAAKAGRVEANKLNTAYDALGGKAVVAAAKIREATNVLKGNTAGMGQRGGVLRGDMSGALNPTSVGQLGRVSRGLSTAYSEVGKPYVWGASGPDAFDCSGLVSYLLSSMGFHYGRMTTSTIQNNLVPGPGNAITVGLNPGRHTGIGIIDKWFEAAHTGAPIRGPGSAKTSWEQYWHPPGFARGGVMYDEGPAILHGSRKRPEGIFTAEQMAHMAPVAGPTYTFPGATLHFHTAAAVDRFLDRTSLRSELGALGVAY